MLTCSFARPLPLLMFVGSLLGAQASAQPLNLPEMPRIDIAHHTQAQRYDNQSVVRAHTTTRGQLDAMLPMTESVWSERIGVGSIDVQIDRDRLADLTGLGIAYDILIPDLEAHYRAHWREVQTLAKQRLDQPHPRGGGVHDDSWFSNYKQFADIIAYFNNIAAVRPDLATMGVAGRSLQNNEIYMLTLSAPDAPGNARSDRPVVIWHGAQHAREWVSPMTVSYLASKFVDDYGVDPRVTDILDHTRLVILPVMNPDGYLYSWSTQRYWRKNRRSNGSGSYGVDLNRNWGYQWGGQGASTNPNDDTYRGLTAFSEPETQVMRDLAISYGGDLAAHIDYHTYSQLILWPFGYAAGVQTPEPDRTFYDNLATDMSNEIMSVSGAFYDPIQSVDLYPASGASSDWFYGDLGIKSLTIELRPENGAGLGGFDPSPSIILPTAVENYEAAKLFVERTTQAVSFGYEPVDVVVAGAPTPVELSVTDVLATHQPGSVTLNARVGTGGTFTPVAMSPQGTGLYRADLPAASCASTIEYYFSLTTTGGDTVTFPRAGAGAPLSALAQEFTVAFEDEMETDTGWVVGHPSDTATTGIWERADPQGTAAQPEDDHTPGTGTHCWVTDGRAGTGVGSYDIDGGATTLISPILDAVILGDRAQLVYWRWYSNDQGASPNEDSMLVQISNDAGNSWTTLETVSHNAGAWVRAAFTIADFVEPTDMIKVRFIASDLGSGSIVEAGVDDLQIVAIGCNTNPADLNGDGTLDFFDISAFLNAFANQDPIADFTNDGVFDFFDISAFLAAFAQG